MDYGYARAREAAEKVGLPNGRMISWSKSGYRRHHVNHFAVFNSTIADETGAGLWWGDVDLTVDEERLVQLAVALETPLMSSTKVTGPDSARRAMSPISRARSSSCARRARSRCHLA